MSDRIYTKATPALTEAVEWLRSASDDSAQLSNSEILARLAETGYRAMRSEQERAEKLAAYEAIAADEERAAEIRAAFAESIEAGLL